MSEWQRVRLDEVIALDVDAVPITATASYDIIGVLNRGRGLLIREPIAGDETSYKTLNRIRPNQIVYSRLKAFEGAITVAPKDLGEVYASQEFPTFTCGERMLPGYFRLLTTTKRLWEQLQALSTGMGGRRERVKPVDFLTIEIALPSLSEQCRIVDVMAAVDAQIDGLNAEKQKAASLLAIFRNAHPEGTEHELRSVVSRIQGGKSVQTSDEKPRTGEPAVLKLSAIQLGAFVASEAKRLVDLTGYTSAHLVTEGDLLITRASGSFDRVGYAAIARNVAPQTYLPDLIWRIQTKPEVCQATFLAHLLCSPSVRSIITASARGTASMRKINKVLLGSLRLPIPSLEDQSNYVQQCDVVAFAVDDLDLELANLRAFRSALLASLLNQEIEIPEAYDALLEEVS
ncbi:restriction endonuclease subunit S [Streptomyces beigongshangae]|uniref:restriction endonuclease subunit S n=1 Tax=Streptomyces beigongshangae TaxID=2841597 RepID=UPI001C853DF9|nr:restriction endonuclease subunit S [Streptomyces sp. REN17]